MQKHSPEKVGRIAGGLDPLHQYLVDDGYGFKTAFFDYRSNPPSRRTLDRLNGYGRNAAYQGVGSAFWFLYRDEHDAMIHHRNARIPHRGTKANRRRIRWSYVASRRP